MISELRIDIGANRFLISTLISKEEEEMEMEKRMGSHHRVEMD